MREECKHMILTLVVISLLAHSRGSTHSQFFTEAEKKSVQAYWSQSGRYAIKLPSSANEFGPFQVRLTPEGSTWLYRYNKLKGAGKDGGGTVIVVTPENPNLENPAPKDPGWDNWIDMRVALDRWNAFQDCERDNSRLLSRMPIDQPQPADPGPCPEGLIALMGGEPPKFASKVRPIQHTVRFEDSEIVLEDNVNMRPKYAYYRFAEGVMLRGQAVRQMQAEEIDGLCKDAGISASQQKVFAAVSMLEGGFDSLNTYDTGYVSVGLIQFACLSGGSGSLGAVLNQERQQYPEEYQKDFRRFGIDVDGSGTLVAISPSDNRERFGTDAALEIIGDKRLAAVFARAGRVSRAFRIAQLQVAKAKYFPVDDSVGVVIGGSKASFKVSSFIKSEAGLATLMDRKVNTGGLGPLANVIQGIVDRTGARTPEEIAPFESEIILTMQFRKNYLEDERLTKPADYSSRAVKPLSSRAGGRGGRGGGETSPKRTFVVVPVKSTGAGLPTSDTPFGGKREV